LEAVNFAKEHPETDLILMDLQMPEMNGYVASREIKKIYPDMIIIAQTAFAMSDDRSKALEAGCDDYLAKPIRSKDLLDTVNKYLNK
jgi:two-component system cell cycle response regulator DivK